MTIPSALVAAIRRPLSKLEVTRAIQFDSTPSDTLLIASQGLEPFVVSSNDRAIGRDLFVRGSYDFEKFETALSLLKPKFNPDLLIDVGANIGPICIPALKRKMFHKAIAIEPEPFNFALLNANLSLNGLLSCVQAHNVAVGSVSRQYLTFELSPTNLGDHRIRISEADGLESEKNRQVIKVRCEKLDKFLKAADPQSTMIWIDTQGFEGHVLYGAKKILQKRPPLVLEFWPYGLDRTGGFSMLRQSIITAGYQKCFALSDTSRSFSPDTGNLNELYFAMQKKGTSTDLLFI